MITLEEETKQNRNTDNTKTNNDISEYGKQVPSFFIWHA